MSLEKKVKELEKQLPGKFLYNKKLSHFSWFNLGGPASILFKPNNLKELSTFLKIFDKQLPIKILGAGSNILIRDGGFKGVIIKLGKAFSHISILKENHLIAGASALDKNVSKFAFENSISGLEFLSCIPGSIGGALKMNSGCYGEEISKLVLSVQAIDFNGNVRVIPTSKIKFYYRGSNIEENLIFVSCTLEGIKKKKEVIKEKMEKLIAQKKATQPSQIKTCGSTFKNPLQGKKKAWELIKFSNCDKIKIGGAKISDKHCNFFINDGTAKSSDLETLIEEVKKRVFEKTGINLELELQVIGDRL